MNPKASKEGVLSKYKGFLIGGWKTMYFVLEGAKLNYYSCVCVPHRAEDDPKL